MLKRDFNSNFIKITLRYGCSPVNLLHIFRTPFTKNTTGLLPLEKIKKNAMCSLFGHHDHDHRRTRENFLEGARDKIARKTLLHKIAHDLVDD